MDTGDALRAMAARSGHSLAQASRLAGRSDRWIATAIAKGGTVGAATLADVAAPLGYALALIPSDKVPAGAIVIDPPKPVE